MRCTSCGLPLSPQRTHCPRCGKVAGESGKEEQVNNQADMPQFAFSGPQEGNNVSPNAETIQGQPLLTAQQQANNQMPEPIFFAPGMEQFPNPANQLPSDQERTFISSTEQPSNWQSPSQPNQRNAPPSTIRPGEFQPFPHAPQRPGQTHSRPKVQPGFTIAGLCVLSGGLILMLVYIISLNLPPLSANQQAASTVAVSTPVSQNVTAGNQNQGGLPTTPPAAALPTATPTPSLPGKVYIDNAQMASSIDMNTALPSQATTTFTVHQQIFVTFMVHPVSSGAVCLSWSINQKQFSQFPFDVGATPQHAYSFAYAPSAGQGSVNIYWASSTACTDKQLAQTVNFTVTP
jgi:hypothetical protein